MRAPPIYRKLDVRFGEATFTANATLAFDYGSGDMADPARWITVQAGRRGTWILEFTPRASLPDGAKVAFTKLEHDFKFAYRYQDYWPEAANYVTVEDERGEPLPFQCDTCLNSAVWVIVTLPHDWKADERIVLRMGDRRHGSAGSAVQANAYERPGLQREC